jgi:DNA-binding beta-propeller fold protein YncE
MHRSLLAVTIGTVLAAQSAEARPREFGIELTRLASISTASVGPTGAEIVAYDAATKRAFAINSTDNALAVIDIADPAAPILLDKVSFAAYGAGLNGVDTYDGLVAVAVEAAPKTSPGKVVFIDAQTLEVRGAVEVGALPDMLTFDDDGKRVLVANEGEPNSYGQADSVNPEGSVSIIDLERGVASAAVRTAQFTAFNDDKARLLASGVRIFGPGASVAQDLEPEYIALKGRTAWVTLQEANAVAVLDIPTASFTDIVPLGLKNHTAAGNALDPSDDGRRIELGSWPVFGMYQPDAVAYLQVGNQRYLVTANEGDSRSSDDFPGFNEETTLVSTERPYVLDPYTFPNAADLKQPAALGKLTVTNASGDTDGDGDFDEIHVFGARSFSIWTTAGDLVWDSGDQFERFFEDARNGYRSIFNANNTSNTVDNRSDNKGPEPEGVAVGNVAGRMFAFIGLERVGGVMAYDVTVPTSPVFAAYANTRNLPPTAVGGDRGPEGIEFVAAEDSPNGKPLVLVGNEVSRTVTIFQVDRRR